MAKQIEWEEKFFCTHSPELISFILNNLSFKFNASLEEIDIYLSDKNKKYIQNNACVRIRKTNNQLLELTQKKAFNSDERVKIEKTINIPIQKEKRLFQLLAKFEILPYCTVQKKRCIYSKTIQSLSYNIVLDIINNQFSFMELEIISSNPTIDLTPQLNEFISLFKDFKIQKAKINYRDFIINQNKSINYKKIK